MSTHPRIIKWEGKVPLPTIPNVNYASFMLDLISQRGENAALVDTLTEKSYTYKELHHMVVTMRNGLCEAGVRFGDAILLLSRNHIDVPIAILSIILSGAACVPVNPTSTEEELIQVMRVSQAKWVVANMEAASKVEAAFESIESGSLKQLWILGESPDTRPCLTDLQKLSSNQHILECERDWGKTVALMPFSSGTTGLPKAVMLSHKNILTNLIQTRFLRSLSKQPSPSVHQRLLLILPMYHIYGFNQAMITLFTGGTLFLLSKFSTEGFMRAIEQYKITFAPITPYVIKLIQENPNLKNFDLSSLIGFASGAAPVQGTSLESLQKKTGRRTLQGFGMTEASGIGTTMRGNAKFNPDSVGPPGPLFQAKVIDVESGRLLGEREEGEICFKGPALMLGYANNPKATAETIDSEGWLHTGDIGYYDEENYFYITDRMKDLIKVKGYQVSPTELENHIMTFRGVADAAVAGIPHKRLGEAPRAWIVPAEGAKIDTNALMKYIADNVAPYKQLAGGVEIVQSIPRNHLGKILRKQLQKTYAANHSKL